mgnify:CR=1 FL=1
MEHLCIGSYVRVLTSCAVPTERKFSSFGEKIFLSIANEGEKAIGYLPKGKKQEITYSFTNFDQIFRSAQNIPLEIKDMAEQKDIYAIRQYFQQKIIPHLAQKESAVLALKKIILNDKTITDDTQLGTIDDLTKSALKNKISFATSNFLTDIFIFALTKTDNKLCPKFTMSIDRKYCDNFLKYADTIRLYESPSPKALPSISKTVRKNFDGVFSHISTETLSVSATHDLQVYALKFDSFSFDYYTLQRYLRSNIGYYLYSRAKIDEYVAAEDTAAISYDAIEDIKGSILRNGVPSGDKLGEILLYIFLESVLNAPKLMSAAENETVGGLNASANGGIHLLTLQNPPTVQLVFGTAIIKGNLSEAIDQSFAKVAELKKHKGIGRHFVDTRILPYFYGEMHEKLASIIIPSESGRSNPETSYGFFIGYSLGDKAIKKKTISDYYAAVLAKIKKDIAKNISNIEAAIDRYGLTGHSVYIYFLPFTDADKDKQRIMNRLLQIGEDTG